MGLQLSDFDKFHRSVHGHDRAAFEWQERLLERLWSGAAGRTHSFCRRVLARPRAWISHCLPSRSMHTNASLIRLDWNRLRVGARAQGVFAVCRSELRRTSQGFGNFSPAVVES